MPHQHNTKHAARLVRQMREALDLTQSQNWRFLSFAPPGHFYSPIPDYRDIQSANYRKFDPDLKDIPGLDINETEQLKRLDTFSNMMDEIPWPADGKDGTLRYHFDNIYFSYGDVVSLFGMMMEFEPERVVEVGSGFSSAAMLDISELFMNKRPGFTFIEPHADRLKTHLTRRDPEQVILIEEPVQQIDESIFSNLRKDDILFIDSSHVSKAGSDVNFLIHRILPSLSDGVIIHFHDIFWPFEYPQKWLKAGRAWNEAYLLLAFLQFNHSFEILFFNSWLEKHHRSLIKQKLPLMLRQPGSKITFGNSSLWLRKC